MLGVDCSTDVHDPIVMFSVRNACILMQVLPDPSLHGDSCDECSVCAPPPVI